MFRNTFLNRNVLINQCWNQLFLFNHCEECLILYEFVCRFLQIFQMSFFNKNSRKTLENINEQFDITEANNSIILLIFEKNKSQFTVYC